MFINKTFKQFPYDECILSAEKCITSIQEVEVQPRYLKEQYHAFLLLVWRCMMGKPASSSFQLKEG